MSSFPGFTSSETFTQIPDSFFRKLLNEIADPAELKVTLYALWRVAHMEGGAHFLRRLDFAADTDFLGGLGGADLDAALGKAVQRGSLLRVRNEAGEFYFLNSPRGRLAAESLQKGEWRTDGKPPAMPPVERPNLFKLYEENIGALTPLIADALKDAEQTYPPEWVAEALEIAVKNNKRNWRYVEAILKRWKVEGHAKSQDRRDAQEGDRGYSGGEFAEYLKRD
jgi:DnaD/phage-associated family protein